MHHGPASARRWARRATARLASDPHVLLALAIALSALIIEAAGGADARSLVLPIVAYVIIQLGVTLSRSTTRRTQRTDAVRLVIALIAVFTASLWTGEVSSLPLTSLYIPIVVMAAAIGPMTMAIVGVGALLAYFGPAIAISIGAPVSVFAPDATTPGLSALLQRGISLIAATTVLMVGARRTVGSLERAIERARTAIRGQRRQAQRMAAVEGVGRLLAREGPTSAALGDVMDLLVARFGYAFASIYTTEDGPDGEITPRLRLGAQRGYADPIEVFDATAGVIGRVLRTAGPALIRDVHADPEYVAADPDVRSEVAVPLLSDDRVIGVLNVESATRELDESDRDALVVVADRVAAALALGRERQRLADRADQMARLATFSARISTTLEPDGAHQAIVDGVAEAVRSDIVSLVRREPGGDDRVVATHGGDQRLVGVRIPRGEGMTAEALERCTPVQRRTLERSAYPATMRHARMPDLVSGVAVPIIEDNEAVGALVVVRSDASRPHSALEIEALSLISAQVALALRNVELHAQMADAAIRDPLTGLWNRRQLEVSTARLFAARARRGPDDRHPVAAIIFDLDHFGSFNKQHGHGTGDVVLRAFGQILAGRLRSSDIVSRFGGEEFVAILDGASAHEATRVADEIRRALEATPFEGANGEPLRATVSAGCASLGPDVASLETLLEVADVALQMAKRAGRNQVVAA